MPAIVTLSSLQNTDQSTTSGTYVNVPGTNTPALVNGKEYLVFYHASCNNETSSGEAECRLVRGPAGNNTANDVLAEVKPASRVPNFAFAGDKAEGVALITGDSSGDVLKYQFNDGGSSTGLVGNASIVALEIPTGWTRGLDWDFFEQSTPASFTDVAGVASWSDRVDSGSFTVPSSENFAIFGGLEIGFTTASTAEAGRVRMLFQSSSTPDSDGTWGDGFQKEWEEDVEVMSAGLGRVVSFPASPTTISIQVQAQTRAVSNAVKTRRARVAWLRLGAFTTSAFSQIAAAAAEGEQFTGDTNYHTATDLSTSIDPDTDDLLLLAFLPFGNDQASDQTVANIRNDTDAVDLYPDVGAGLSDGGFDSASDNWSLFMPVLESAPGSGSNSYVVQGRVTDAADAGYIGRNQEDDAGADSMFLLLRMFTDVVPPAASDQPMVFFGMNF